MFNGHNNVSDRAEKLADEAEKNLRDWGREAHQHADNAKSDMVKTLYDSAKNLRKEARDAGATDDVLHRVDDVATGFEKAATYLKRHSYEDMGEDAVKTVKRYPLQTMAILFVVGVVIGLLLRGDSSQRR